MFGELLKALSFLTQFQENFNSSMFFSRHNKTLPFHLHGQRLVLCGWERSLRLNYLFSLSSTLIPSIKSRTLFAWFLIYFWNHAFMHMHLSFILSCCLFLFACLFCFCLSFLTQFQENFNSSMFFSRHTRTHAFSSSRPKTRAVWVRKEPKT